MDAKHFDTLTRTLSTGSARRRVLRLFAGLGLAGLVGQAEAKRKKKKKRKKKQSPSSPPPGCTPSCERKVCGSDGCGGSCGACGTGEACATGRCVCEPECTNRVCGSDGCSGSCGTCPIAGQQCTAGGQCQCPAAIPVACGGVCQAISCRVFEETVDLERCRCCATNFRDARGSAANCCSQRVVNGACYGREPGENCTFAEQCLSSNCVHGTCSGCGRNSDYCTDTIDVCLFSTAPCLKAIDGTVRCGIPEVGNEGDCGWCTRDYDCDQGQRPGYFCAVSTGPNCTCPVGQTFCAAPA